MRKPTGHQFESRSRTSKRSNEGKMKSISTTEAGEQERSIEAGMLALPEEDVTERRHSKVFVGKCREGPALTARR